ncbi:zinc ribbon domain-containing protein [Candidatus Latescibacterota bacterium]
MGHFTCSECGAKVDSNVNFCPNCGTAFDPNVKKVKKWVSQDSEPHKMDIIPPTKEKMNPIFFSVSIKKLIIMSLCTFGIYEIYWFYKNWKLIKERTEQKMLPFWRAVFAIFFCYPLFKSIKNSAYVHGVQSNISPGWLTFAYIALFVTWRLPDPIWLLCFLTFLPLISPQEVINEINATEAPTAEVNDKFSWKNIIAIVVGGILLIFGVLGAFIPE